jgi:hypothetical protein
MTSQNITASSTIKTGRHDIAESGVKTKKNQSSNLNSSGS